MFRYRLSPETFAYTFVNKGKKISIIVDVFLVVTLCSDAAG